MDNGRWRMNSMGEHSPFFIQRNKFTLSIRTVKSGSVSHFQFSILFCSAVISTLFFSALVCSTVLYCSLLFCSLLFSALCTFLARNTDFLARNALFLARNKGAQNKSLATWAFLPHFVLGEQPNVKVDLLGISS